jgi:hypothetical protein
MEEMRLDLGAKGHDVAFVGINSLGALEFQQDLVDRCSFPLLQDLVTVKAFEVHHQGMTDDIYVYDRDGKLFAYLPGLGGATDLSTEEGYAKLEKVILDAEK